MSQGQGQGQGLWTQFFVLKSPRRRGQVLKDTSLHNAIFIFLQFSTKLSIRLQCQKQMPKTKSHASFGVVLVSIFYVSP